MLGDLLHPWWEWPVAETVKPEAALATIGDALHRGPRTSAQAAHRRRKKASKAARSAARRDAYPAEHPEGSRG
jgi:hypothetical protein